jgi:hypothetical protein
VGKVALFLWLADEVIRRNPQGSKPVIFLSDGERALHDRQSEKTPKTMLRHFFEHAPASVREPIRDSTGQSVHVDEYLGPADSLKRRIIADSLGQIGRKLKNADGARSLDLWKEPLDETS